MPRVPTTPDGSAHRVRIAISSPDVLAQIRREFAGHGLTAQIDGVPTVDVVITGDLRGRLRDVVQRLAGPESYRRDPATARYRLTIVRRTRKTLPRNPTAGYATTSAAARPASRSLSPRETEVMESLSRGMRTTAIGSHLEMSEKTVRNHINRIFAKLGAHNRVEAVLIWQAGAAAEGDLDHR